MSDGLPRLTRADMGWDAPTPQRGVTERCPTCGSTAPTVSGHLGCLDKIGYQCPDKFHTPAPVSQEDAAPGWARGFLKMVEQLEAAGIHSPEDMYARMKLVKCAPDPPVSAPPIPCPTECDRCENGPSAPESAEQFKADSLFGIWCDGKVGNIPRDGWSVYWEGWQRLADWLNKNHAASDQLQGQVDRLQGALRKTKYYLTHAPHSRCAKDGTVEHDPTNCTLCIVEAALGDPQKTVDTSTERGKVTS